MKAREGLTFKVELRDEKGNVVGETDAVTLKGLLTLAHEDGLRKTKTKLTQKPSKENGNVAIAKAQVRTMKGRFSGIGDASPDNVEPRFAMHLPRIAETRALARALRVAVNIGEVAFEELGTGASIRHAPKVTEAAAERPARPAEPKPAQPAGAPPPQTEASSPSRERERRAMSDAQRKLLFRLAFDLGATKENVREHVLRALGVERLEWAEREMASAAIDKLQAEVAKRPRREEMNGGAHHGGP